VRESQKEQPEAESMAGAVRKVHDTLSPQTQTSSAIETPSADEVTKDTK
jgi:polyphosphate kinase 2 (PPK2 family)